MFTDLAALSRESTTTIAMWEIVNKRLRSRKNQSQTAPPLAALEQKERKAFSREPFSEDRKTQQFVKHKMQQINNAASTPTTPDERQAQIHELANLTEPLCANLKPKSQ